MFIKGKINLGDLRTEVGGTLKRLRPAVRRNKKTVAAGLMLLLLAGIAYAGPRAVVTASQNAMAASKELPIYCVDRKDKVVALTFDAAWGNEDTQQILDILEKHNVKVTFFATGGWVETYPEDVKKIIDAGHAFGNHSENHKFMTKLSDEQKKQELMKVHDKVKALTGYEMCLFRPPYGDYNDAVVRTAESLGYYTIQWSVDSLDWKDYGVDSIIKTVTQHKNLDSGAIILMHNGAKYTADALDSVITNLKEQGYSFVTVAQLIHTGKYHIDHTGKQIADE